MSHFCVIVTGENVEEQLQPFHEFECTGEDDQYIQEIDETEAARENYAKQTMSVLRGPDGELICAYDDRFHRDPTPEELEKIGKFAGTGAGHGMSWTSKDWGDGLGYRTKVHFVPEGWTEDRVPYSEVQTFREFVQEYYGRKVIQEGSTVPMLPDDCKYGYALANAEGEIIKVVDRTNPNAKWDWWVVGGRWTGFFTLKPGIAGELGSPGLMTPAAPLGTADVARKGDIDWEYMRVLAETEAGQTYDRIRAILDANPGFKPWEVLREEFPSDIDAARKSYHEQPAVKALFDAGEYFRNLEHFVGPRENYVAEARARAGVPFAILHEGKWYERGEMGWWGIVSDEKSGWEQQAQALIDSLPDDTLLSIVDCHI